MQWSDDSGFSLTPVSGSSGLKEIFEVKRTPGTGTASVVFQNSSYQSKSSISFSVVAPNAYSVAANPKDVPGCVGSNFVGTQTSSACIGAWTKYTVKLLPDSVNYYNTCLQEDFNAYAAGDKWTFPDGTQSSKSGIVLFGSSEQACDNYFSLSSVSNFIDNIADPGPGNSYPATLMAGATTNFSYPVTWQVEYQGDAGNPVTAIKNINTNTTFSLALTGQESYLGVSGAAQGPFVCNTGVPDLSSCQPTQP